MTAPIRLAVVDDHPLLREGVVRSLGETGIFSICGEGASAADALRLASAERPDILLLDMSMPGGGLNAIREVRAVHPDLKLVVLTVSENDEDVTAALNAGARAYVLKGVGSKTLADILQSVAKGESFVSPILAARMLERLREMTARPAEANPLSRLTERETEILALVSQGFSNKEVAIRLDLHEKTVKHHMTSILAKLQVRNRTEAALAMRNAAIR
jgi:DNA-binding NarL/FixJ family response regulator